MLGMGKPSEKILSALCDTIAEFNLIHFRDAAHGESAPAHYWVSVSMGDGQCMLLSMVTSQIQNLDRRYASVRPDKAEALLNSLVPLSKSDLSAINKDSVVNCNDAVFLSKRELIKKIDAAYVSRSQSCFDIIHRDMDFGFDLKNRIIQAISDSPDIKPEVKENIAKIRKILSPPPK